MNTAFDSAPIAGFEPQLGLLLAALQDGTREGRDELGDADEDLIVWQPKAHSHSIGAILLHIGDCENFWVEEIVAGKTPDQELAKRLLSVETKQYASRWPTPPRMPLADYYAILDDIRKRTFETMRDFHDPADTREHHGQTLTIRWILAHVVEHESYHLGQAVLLKAIRDEHL